ncbi:MAG: coenzyme F420-0:L-glutamate ligase [Candidatus Peribacteraceae bacterium]
MQLIPIHTPVLKRGDDIAAILAQSERIRPGDIVVVSSKAVATVEGAATDLGARSPSPDAERYAKTTGRTAPFMQAVLDETARLNGSVRGTCPGALLTEVTPQGFPHGTILTANAGMDQSNIEDGFAIGWPRDPVASARKLKEHLEALITPTSSASSESSDSSDSSQHNPQPPPALAVILTDSACRPRRWGVTAFALVSAGLDPLLPQKGARDLFDKELRITTEAVADQLATAANMVMGNAGQRIPAVIIRDHGYPLSGFEGWVPGIEPEEDLFRGVI